VGGAASENTECAAGDCLGKWPATRFLAVDPSRATRHRGFAVVTPCRLADWRTTLCPPGAFPHILTVDLQNTLKRGDNRPLLFSGDLTDVSDRNGEPVITISQHLCRDANLRIEAIADAEQVRLVMSHRSDRAAYFAMAVRVTSIQKQQLNPAPVNTDGDDNLGPSDEFVVSGNSVQVLSTGVDGMLLDIHNRVHSLR
jgi:hypothetical protein